MYILDVILVIAAAIAFIVLVVYIIYWIVNNNRMRPPQFVRPFTLFPRNGCPGTMATIDWETMDDDARTLTRRRAAGEDTTSVGRTGPITEPVVETTTYAFEATKTGHTPITGNATFTVFGDGATRDMGGTAFCHVLQTAAEVFDVWRVGESFDPRLWHERLKVRSITLIVGGEHRNPLFVVHNGDIEAATALTEAVPTVMFSAPPSIQGEWMLFTRRLAEERCTPNDTRPGTLPYQPVRLGITMTFSC